MFLFFLTLSSLFWVVTKLSKEYTHTVLFKAIYTNLAKDKIVQSEPTKNLIITLKTSGFGLFNYSIKKKKIKIDIQNLLRKNNDLFYYLPNDNIASFQDQISSDVSIVSILPDTLFFNFGSLNSKKVKIKPNFKLHFKTGYNLVKKIQITPEFITISGPEKQLNSITTITTGELALKNISKNFKKIIPIILPEKSKNINFSHSEIVVEAKVDKFTEGTIKLPYQLINVPNKANISAFIDEVTISYRVSLANFDKIQASDFKIICDFSKTQQGNLNYLIPTFEKQSSLVLDAKILPEKIEFLIKK